MPVGLRGLHFKAADFIDVVAILTFLYCGQFVQNSINCVYFQLRKCDYLQVCYKIDYITCVCFLVSKKYDYLQ